MLVVFHFFNLFFILSGPDQEDHADRRGRRESGRCRPRDHLPGLGDVCRNFAQKSLQRYLKPVRKNAHAKSHVSYKARGSEPFLIEGFSNKAIVRPHFTIFWILHGFTKELAVFHKCF